VAKSSGRTTRRWRTVIRPSVLGASDVCWWCGHTGARAVDHLIPLSQAPDLAEELTNLAPIHGRERCPTCRRNCNSERGRSAKPPVTAGSRDW